ncbi:synaptopodin [Osmerus mordax]|uniref:synaptopodin n=1 Tax=Osmerus mordax TaxID=8014 RepID=UPI00350FADB0
METERGHMSVRRGVSWSPGGQRKPLQVGQEAVDLVTESNASWDRRDYTEVKGQSALASSTDQMPRKANLTRSASLSDKDLKEARVRSQIIAAQLTVPSNSNSRGVQLFNRRKKRVNAFTLESGIEGGTGRGAAEDDKHIGPPRNNLTWAERASEGKDRERNLKNIASKPPWSPTRLAFRGSDIMEEPSEPVHEVEDVADSVIQERHFLPVNEKEEDGEVKMKEEEELRQEVPVEQESEVKNDLPSASDHSGAVQCEPELGEPEVNGAIPEPESPGDLHNGCHSAPEKVSVSLSKQPSTIINRTARPFFSPTTVQSPDTRSPVMDIPPAPSYSTPPLPRPVAFSPPPPPPSYPTPPLPAYTCQSPQAFSSPLCMSPAMSPLPPPVCQYAPPSAPQVSQYVPPTPPVTQYAPPTAPRPSTFVPKPAADWKPHVQIKSGILEEGAARRGTRKSMFTFKEKPVMAPNPELLSLVQGADERKKHGPRCVVEPASEEELLALGAEASNFLAKEEVKLEEAAMPEWSTTLKSSRTRARTEHKPEQTLTNATGKGAELFAKRQSRMEKYVLEKQNAGQRRSPSPTMSLPPSWVYPSNMPGRVKAIATNSNISDQLSRTLKAQQPVQRKPSIKAPPPKPESPPLENGCTKIEMDLSRHQPYQLNSSLFIFNPIKDPRSSLPRGAPPPKPVVMSYSRQTSLPTSPSSHFSLRPAHCLYPQHPLSPVGGMGPVDQSHHYGGAPRSRQPRITSPVSAFSPERVASPRSGAQAPRPTFSAKKAGIEPQVWRPSIYF